MGLFAVWLLNPKSKRPTDPAAEASPQNHPEAVENPAKNEDFELRSPARQRDRQETASNKRLEQLEEFASDLKDKIVVDHGTVDDIGKQTAKMLGYRKELLRLRSIAPGERSAEEKQRLLELERENAVTMVVLPEIAAFQNDPAQYAQFFASLVQEAAGLDQRQRQIVYDYMKQRGERMIFSGLNAANEPNDPAAEATWEEHRDEFNKQTAQGVAGLLDPGEAERIGFNSGFLELLEQDFDEVDVDE